MRDSLIKAITTNSNIRVTAVYTKEIVERARQIHKTLPVATAALGRTLSATSIIGANLKNEDGSVTVQIKGGGPLGSIVCVSDSQGRVRGYLQNPAVDIPLKPNGKLDVSGAVGQDGFLTVIKDLSMKEPFIGTTALVSGEIAEDVTSYFAQSEQIGAACALGVLVDTDQSVKQAGGYIIEVMPNADDGDIMVLEHNIANIAPVTTLLDQGLSMEDIVRKVLEGFDVEILEQTPICYDCKCTRERVSQALISIGKKDLLEIVENEEKIEMTCQFCDEIYNFSKEEILEMI
ncbi:MAG: Hsp33 family molecular chaperone HslO [Clostridia bacterium]